MEFTDAALSANDVFHRSGAPRKLGNCRSCKRSRLLRPGGATRPRRRGIEFDRRVANSQRRSDRPVLRQPNAEDILAATIAAGDGFAQSPAGGRRYCNLAHGPLVPSFWQQVAGRLALRVVGSIVAIPHMTIVRLGAADLTVTSRHAQSTCRDSSASVPQCTERCLPVSHGWARPPQSAWWPRGAPRRATRARRCAAILGHRRVGSICQISVGPWLESSSGRRCGMPMHELR